MNTKKSLKLIAKHQMKNENAKILIILFAIFLYIPLFTIFIPKITILLYCVFSLFSFPYYKMAYFGFRGKNLELDNIIDFSGFKEYALSKIIIVIKSIPLLICVLTTFILCYVSTIDPEWWPFLLYQNEKDILFYVSFSFMTIFCIILFFNISKNNLTKYLIIDKMSVTDSFENLKQKLKGHTVSYILYMLPLWLFLIIGLVLLGIPALYIFPFLMYAESAWFYETYYEKECINSFYKKTEDYLNRNINQIETPMQQHSINQPMYNYQKPNIRPNPWNQQQTNPYQQNYTQNQMPQQTNQRNWPPNNNNNQYTQQSKKILTEKEAEEAYNKLMGR